MFYIDESNRKQHCYVTYGRQFLRYRWFKPIIAGIVFMICYFALAIALVVGVGFGGESATGQSFSDILSNLSTSYETLNVNTLIQTLLNLGQLVIMIPALFITSLIVRDRPFSSYSSSRGGWSWKLFFRCLGICLIVAVIPIVVYTYITEGPWKLDIKFTLYGFIGLLILGPLQCIAEEYVFRGLLMQTLGSWFRIPVIAVILQAAVFAASHPYNWTGKAAILVSGIGFGLSAWIARGIEASSAIHVANNMTAFILMGLGLSRISSEIGTDGLIFDACMYSAYVIILLILSRKTEWFNTGRKDDLAKANEKEEARRARKAGKAGGKGASAGTVHKVIDFTSDTPEQIVGAGAKLVTEVPSAAAASASAAAAVSASGAAAADTSANKESSANTEKSASAPAAVFVPDPFAEDKYDIPEEPEQERVGRVARNKDKY